MKRMDRNKLVEQTIRQTKKANKLARDWLKDRTKPLAQQLYPEIPWTEGEVRAYLYPAVIRPWTALPFYEKPIIPIVMLRKGENFKDVYGLNYEDILELWNKRRIYPIVEERFEDFHHIKSDHLQRIFEKEPPTIREPSILFHLAGIEKVEEYEREYEKIDDVPGNRILYAALCSAGLRDRVREGYNRILSLKDRQMRDIFRTHWLGFFSSISLTAHMLDSIPVMDQHGFSGITWPLGHFTSNPEQALIQEVAEELLIVWDLVAPANPKDVNIDLIIATQDHAKDLRKAYSEFRELVQDLKIKEGLETFENAVGPLAEEYRRSSPILDDVDKIAINSMTVSITALTAAALIASLRPDVLALLPSGATVLTQLGILRSEWAKKWMRGQYSKVLSKIGMGPFKYTHTWRAHRIIDKAKAK